MTPLTERQKVLIVNNVVRACDDIERLNKTGYNFLYLSQGFIAHYNIFGFKDFYKVTAALDTSRSAVTLRDDILRNANANKWLNFRPGDRDYDYYRAKADVYARIVERIR